MISPSFRHSRVPEAKPYDRSAAARAQPRDDMGRFCKIRPPSAAVSGGRGTMIVVDEFGNLGPYHEGERYFGYTLSVTDRPEEFGRISSEHMERQLELGRLPDKIAGRVRRKGELKARDDTPSGRREVLRQINGLGTERMSFFVDKKNPPEGWSGSGKAKAVKMIEYALDEAKSRTPGDLDIVVDYSTVYGRQDEVQERSRQRVEDGRRITEGTYSSSKGRYSSQLQTQDYAAYNAFERTASHLWVLDPRISKVRSLEPQNVEKERALRRPDVAPSSVVEVWENARSSPRPDARRNTRRPANGAV